MPRRPLLAVLALVWLAAALPRADTRYSYNWDSSQFERGAAHFDIARHQPHPPGYPLWILAIRGLAALTGRVNSAQVILALLFTAAALGFFFPLARGMLGEEAAAGATAVLAFSPLVMLHATAPLTYAVDLFASCSLAWFAARLWAGEARWAPAAFATAAVTAGFRQSGVTFLLPLLCVALMHSWRKRPWIAVAGLATGAALFLAWYIPTALLTGGPGRLAALDRAQMLSALRQTSAFFGAPAAVHAHMAVDAAIYISFALVGIAALLATAWPLRKPPEAAFFLLWLGPNLAMIFLLHCGEPGYVLLSLPPLAILGAWLTHPIWERRKWTVAAAAIGLAAGYFPYEQFVNPARATVAYQLLRASPRLPWLLEDAQRQIRAAIDSMPGPAGTKLIFCLRDRTEAPNIRTVTYEYPDVRWADFRGPGLRVFEPGDGAITDVLPRAGAIAWLCDGGGLPAELRADYPQARPRAGNKLFSFWTNP